MKKIITIVLAFVMMFSSFSYADTEYDGLSIKNVNESYRTGNDGKVKNQSELVNSLCTLILILNGRIARVLAAVAIFAVGIMFFLGKITWPILVTVGVAMGLVFGAKNVAIIMLPRVVAMHDERDGTIQYKTSSEIISQACPELK